MSSPSRPNSSLEYSSIYDTDNNIITVNYETTGQLPSTTGRGSSSSSTSTGNVNKSMVSEQSLQVKRIAHSLVRADFNEITSNASKSTSGIKSTASIVLNEIEAAILRSKEPLEISQMEEISVNGHRGILLNKCELDNWSGPMPLAEYPINQDPAPQLITKKSGQHIEYIKELAIR
jgi:hypothetical protein